MLQVIDATLNSNRGNSRLVLSFGSRCDWGDHPGIETDFRLYGRHNDGDHERELRVAIQGLTLGVAAIARLGEKLATWSALPLSELAVTELAEEHDLAIGLAQRLRLTFGGRADTISERNPVVTVQCSAGKLKGEYHFVTDQSCIAAFGEDLQGIVQERLDKGGADEL